MAKTKTVDVRVVTSYEWDCPKCGGFQQFREFDGADPGTLMCEQCLTVIKNKDGEWRLEHGKSKG